MIVLASGLRERGLPLPKELDDNVAKLHLPAPGAALNVLTQEHAGYTGVKIEGSLFKDNPPRSGLVFTNSSDSYIERLSPLSCLRASWHALEHTQEWLLRSSDGLADCVTDRIGVSGSTAYTFRV